jgi:predicted Fe-Mo cluster-binding NifX family protein
MTTKRVSIPVVSEDGLSARVSPHFGRAPLHLILEEDGTVAALLRGDPAEGGKALPLESLSALGVGAVLCPGLGRGAHDRLASTGIAVLHCEASTSGEALAQYMAGQLQPVTEEMLEARTTATGRRAAGACAGPVTLRGKRRRGASPRRMSPPRFRPRTLLRERRRKGAGARARPLLPQSRPNTGLNPPPHRPKVTVFDMKELSPLEELRHSASHILATAILRLYPEAKLDIGPTTDAGFYYDIDLDKKLTTEDLEKIEAEMYKIVKENQRFTRTEVPARRPSKSSGRPGRSATNWGALPTFRRASRSAFTAMATSSTFARART